MNDGRTAAAAVIDAFVSSSRSPSSASCDDTNVHTRHPTWSVGAGYSNTATASTASSCASEESCGLPSQQSGSATPRPWELATVGATFRSRDASNWSTAGSGTGYESLLQSQILIHRSLITPQRSQPKHSTIALGTPYRWQMRRSPASTPFCSRLMSWTTSSIRSRGLGK